MTRVLHITESFGAGVASAIRTYAQRSDEHEHILLRTIRDGEYVVEDDTSTFSSVLELPKGHFSAARAIRATISQMRPDVVHVHSSIAGLLTRLSTIRRRDRTLVYSPHCFAFERRDISLPVRVAIFLTEFALSLNTTTIAACSPREAAIAGRMLARTRPVVVPNTPPCSPGVTPSEPLGANRWAIITTGRLGPQKDPQFFLNVVNQMKREIDKQQVPIAFSPMWIGAGEEAWRRSLTGSGVTVSGWVSRQEASNQLASASVYVHTAAWEGFPIAILEAHALGLPIVVRRISAYGDVGADYGGDDPDAVAALALALLTSEHLRTANIEYWASYLAQNQHSIQKSRLAELYGRSSTTLTRPPSTVRT